MPSEMDGILKGRVDAHQLLIVVLLVTLARSSPDLGRRMLAMLDDLAVNKVEARDKGAPEDAAEGYLQAITEARNVITPFLK